MRGVCGRRWRWVGSAIDTDRNHAEFPAALRLEELEQVTRLWRAFGPVRVYVVRGEAPEELTRLAIRLQTVRQGALARR